MKMASVLVVVAVLILPTLILVSYIGFQLIKKGVKGMDAFSTPSPKLQRFRSQHRILFYLASSSYSLVLIGAICWAVYEYSANFGVQLQLSIAGVSIFFIMMVAYIVWMYARAEKIRKKFPPPEIGSSSEELLAYQNKIVDETAKYHDLKYFLRLFLIVICILLLISAITLIAAYFSAK